MWRLPSADAPVRRHAELEIAVATNRTKPPAACCEEFLYWYQGSEAWGVGLTVAGLVLPVACRWPHRSWNLAAQAYSALENLSTK